MKISSFRSAAVLLAGLASHCFAPAAHANAQSRAEYRNLSSAQATSQSSNPGVATFSGYIKGTQTQTANAVVLQDCAFGQAFSQWYPSDTYAKDIIGVAGVSGVKGALYPDTSAASTRSTIQGSGKPFRYKWLLYNGTGTDVTAFDATSIAGWFTDADRTAIYGQIANLRGAIAASPLDTSLRNTLLDVYYDLAVAEMQAAKPKLAELAKYRLGLEAVPPDKFIIDKEIDTYSSIDTAFLAAISQYTALLTESFPNIDPSSFDSRVGYNTIPMGRYIFIREQPNRNSTPSQYANGSGIQEVPDVNATTNLAMPRPSGQVLFSGYKDLNALLQLIGQRQQHQASLARLRGTRQSPGDVALARQSVEQASGPDQTALGWVKSGFPEIFPANLNGLTPLQRTGVERLQEDSGVLASLSAIESARIDLTLVTPFLNGSANMLGYDPAFLLLVQDQTNQVPPLESYDTLRNMLTAGTNQPLSVALEKLNTASELYQNFQEKVDQTAADIDAADEALADRYFAITGFEPDASPGFNLVSPNPKAGSELAGVLATIAALDLQAEERKPLTAEFDDQLRDDADAAKDGAAVAAVTSALAKEDALLNAGVKYKNTTRPLYEEMIGMSAGAAAAQGAYDTWVDAASAPTETVILTGGTVAAITAVAGTANTIMQTAAAAVIGLREQDIDYAAIDFAVTTESVDAALNVSLARQELSALKREQIANKLAITADTSAKAQAEAQKAALIAELARIVTKRDGNVLAIRKKSYADPLHYHHAEYALIDADESFRTAQRWMFYTLQALNYKWHGRFASTQGSKSYDSSTVFKCRNAQELNDLLTQMVQWNQVRVTQTNNSLRIVTRISLRDHILSRNPRRFDAANPSDPGTRADDTVATQPLPMVSTVQYFRNLLTTRYTEAGTGDLVIPFSTVFRNEPADRVDGSFFRGASYDTDGDVISPGFWREKIEYVKVKILARTGSGDASVGGAIDYGGTTFFHTRVPPRGDRTLTGLAPDDAPGELLVAPFRYWESPDFSENFVAKSRHRVTSENIPYTATPTAITYDVNGNGLDNAGPPIRAFAGRSIAATGWNLRINRVTGLTNLNVNNIDDIEFIIAYKHSDRVTP